MDTRRETLPNDGTSLWAGMANYILVTADAKHEIELRYLGEPPHGDLRRVALLAVLGGKLDG